MPKHGASPLGVRDNQEAGARPPPPPRPGAEPCTPNPSPEPTRGDTSPKGGHPGLLQTLHLAVPARQRAQVSLGQHSSGREGTAGRRASGLTGSAHTAQPRASRIALSPGPGPSQQGSSSQREALEGVKCN